MLGAHVLSVDACLLTRPSRHRRKQSEWSIAQVGQGGLGLPDRDYYYDEDKEEKRKMYKDHISASLLLLGAPYYADAGAADAAASAVYELEKAIAGVHMTRTERRDPEKTYNKMTVADLQAKCDAATGGGGIQFSRLFAGAGKPAETLGDINVSTLGPYMHLSLSLTHTCTYIQWSTCITRSQTCPYFSDAVVGISKIFKEASADVLSSYFRWSILRTFMGFDLPKAFADLHFGFFETALKGTKEQKPRWKRAMQQIESVLGEALGELYVAKYFSAAAKSAALDVVERVRIALKERLEEVKWMSDATRERAMLKMAKFSVKIGFPDKWIDFSTLEVVRGDHFGNQLRANTFEHNRMLAYMNAPTDRSRWYMTPQTINAYYHPSLNEIVFPAAILAPPFFSADADDAVNFGAMGAVVGHEMTHGFDDQGRKYDHTGNMVDWWTEADGLEYEKRVQVMVDQAEQFVVFGQPLKGKLTCGENIADLGGLKLAYRALCSLLKERGQKPEGKDTMIGGFTAQQRFFLSWAKVWAQNIEEERAKQLVTTDPHGPNEFRVNGPLKNIPEFHSAFLISDGTPMCVPPAQRVDIW